MSEKRCNKCGETKPHSEFHRQANAPDGRKYACAMCSTAYARAWNLAHPERARASCYRYKAKNPMKAVAWRQNNKDYLAAYTREWRKRWASKRSVGAYSNEGNRAAMPPWANRFILKEAYRLARLRTALTGIVWEVDHIIPLRHPDVCGLHAETNIRVIPMFANRSRGNRGWRKEIE